MAGYGCCSAATTTATRTKAAPSPCTPWATTRPSPAWPPASSASSCPTSSTGSRSIERVAGRGKSDVGRAGPRRAGARSSRIAGSTSRRPTPGSKAIEEYGAGHDNYRQKRLDQIVGNWGRFEPAQVAAGRQEGRRRFPLPQRQQGLLRGPRHQGGQAARRREGLPQEQPRPARLEQAQHRQHRLSPGRAEARSSTSATRSPPGTWT